MADNIQYFRDRETNEVLAFVVRHDFEGKKYNFLTPNDYPLQMGINSYEAGETIQPHVHTPAVKPVRSIQECLLIREGRLTFFVFDHHRNLAGETELNGGDVVFLAAGGHGFKILEKTRIIEVKQGPFGGEPDKVRFAYEPLKNDR